MDNSIFIDPEERIEQKNEIYEERNLQKSLLEENTGFEGYEIFYDKNSILNLSIGIQNYGAAGKQYNFIVSI